MNYKVQYFIPFLLTATIASSFSKAWSQSGFMMEGKPITDTEARAAELVKESMITLNSGNVKDALQKAESAKAMAPNFYYALGALGVCLARAGRSEDAIVAFKEALKHNPDMPDTIWSLAATYQSAGQTDEAINTFKEFVAKYPSNSKVSQANAFISGMGGHPHAIHSANADNYFDEAIGADIMRWPNDSIPIKIFVRPADKVRGYKPLYDEQLNAAMAAWEEASQGKIKFERVNSSDKASILFAWSDNPSDVSNATEGGEALLRPIGNSLKAARITVLTVEVAQGLHLTDQLMRLICMHELGHALGISGHSSSPQDLMYSSVPLDYERVKISDRDAKTLQKLYSIDVASVPHSSITAEGMLSGSEITNSGALAEIDKRAREAMAAKKYGDAESILKDGLNKFPDSFALKHNLAAVLNNEGMIALQAEQFPKALATFEQALKWNPESKAATANIAIVHYNAGLTSMRLEKYAEAAPELKMAIEKFEANKNNELLNKAANEYVLALRKTGKLDQAKLIESKYGVAGAK